MRGAGEGGIGVEGLFVKDFLQIILDIFKVALGM